MKKKKGGSVFAIWDFRLSFLLAHFSKKVARMNKQNLKPCTPENARERQLKSAENRKQADVWSRKKILCFSLIFPLTIQYSYVILYSERRKTDALRSKT